MEISTAMYCLSTMQMDWAYIAATVEYSNYGITMETNELRYINWIDHIKSWI